MVRSANVMVILVICLFGLQYSSRLYRASSLFSRATHPISQSGVENPKPFVNSLVGHPVIVKLKWGGVEYRGAFP